MTTAKPKHMAGQTDSADDLIAELARLMAEDAQGDKPKIAPAAPVRIPGGDVSAAVASPRDVDAPVRSVRIPGDSAPAAAQESARFDMDRSPRPAEAKVDAPQRVEPTGFAPIFPTPRPAAQAAPVATPIVERRFAPEPTFAPQPPAQPVSIAPQDVVAPTVSSAPEEPAVVPDVEMPALDQDSLADLIAAELSVAPEPVQVQPFVQDEPPEELDVTGEVSGQDFPREVDSFGIPPVFGLASTVVKQPEVEAAPIEPQVVEPTFKELKLPKPDLNNDGFLPPPHHHAEARPDPLEEIERLIGPAARIHQAPPPPSPALRSLATPTLPREQDQASAPAPAQNSQVSSIEEAILAAAATSGARVEWVEPVISARLPDDEPAKATRAPRGRVLGMTRSLAGPVVATLLLAVAAVGLYAVLGLGSTTPEGPAPLVAADTTPTKEVPVPAVDAAESSQSVVFNEIAGVDTGADEQIVSRDQADVDAVTQVASADVNEEGLVNRKVRTVTVRPDGTIVSGGDSVAGSAMLPVDRPSVPDVPGADFSTPDLIANAPSTSATALPEPAAAAAAPQVTPVQPGSTVPVVDLTGTPITGKTAPVPLVRPSTFAPQAAATVPAITTPQQAEAVAPAPVAALPAVAPVATEPQAVTAAPAGSSAPAYVQLSSQRSEEAARQTAQDIASRFGALFNGANLEVQRVDLGERGVFYRVRVPADSLQSANTICSNVKASGGDCYTL